MRFSGKLALGAALAVVGGAALAAEMATVIAARQANFKVMGKAMKASFGELKSPTPQIAVMRDSARAIAEAAPKVATFFPKGSGPQAGVKTEALPAIWEKPADFKAKADNLVKAAVAYKAAADAGNMDATKAALMQLGGTCKACHTDFKAKD